MELMELIKIGAASSPLTDTLSTQFNCLNPIRNWTIVRDYTTLHCLNSNCFNAIKYAFTTLLLKYSSINHIEYDSVVQICLQPPIDLLNVILCILVILHT